MSDGAFAAAFLRNFLQQIQLGPTSSGSFHAHESIEEDTSETVEISALALLKMLKHGKDGVPFEVMGLLLGDFVDVYTVRVVDVFAMPQMATAASVEAIDSGFQVEMLTMLNEVGRTENAVGWYHSHPGYGCWLSAVDQNTQVQFELVHPRAVAVVVDPIQSVKGKVILDSFRNIPNLMAGGPGQREMRHTTSCLYDTEPPGPDHRKQLIRGLNRRFYKLVTRYTLTEMDAAVLSKVQKSDLLMDLRLSSYQLHKTNCLQTLTSLNKALAAYKKELEETNEYEKKHGDVECFGKENVKKSVEALSTKLIQDNLMQNLCAAENLAAFRFQSDTDLSHSDPGSSCMSTQSSCDY